MGLEGGTGMIGKQTCVELYKAGYKISIFSRNIENGKKKLGDLDSLVNSFEFFEGNLDNKIELKEAMKDVKFVHISLPIFTKLEIIKKIVDAAKEMENVERISLISGDSVSKESSKYSYVLRNKYAIEKYVKENSKSYNIFRPSMLFENLPKMVIKGKGTIIGGKSQMHDLKWISACDVGKMVSRALLKKKHENKIFYCRGKTFVNQKEALELFLKTCRPDVDSKKIKFVPFWILKIMGVVKKNKGLQYAADLFSCLYKYRDNFKTDEEIENNTKELIDETEYVTIQQWCKEFGELNPVYIPSKKKKFKLCNLCG